MRGDQLAGTSGLLWAQASMLEAPLWPQERLDALGLSGSVRAAGHLIPRQSIWV